MVNKKLKSLSSAKSLGKLDKMAKQSGNSSGNSSSSSDFTCINPQGRQELVGKRFLLVSSNSKLKLSRISEWNWRAGVIRCASHLDLNEPELQVSSLSFFNFHIKIKPFWSYKFNLLRLP